MHRLRSKVAIGQVMSKGYREEVGLNELLDFELTLQVNTSITDLDFMTI